MFQFFGKYYQEFAAAPSWITQIAQLTSTIVAGFALYIACKNLGGIKRSQALQGQMNLISLENEMRKNSIQYKISLDEYSKAELKDAESFGLKRINAFELYVTSADKLAALINADFLNEQFPNRDWETEYREIFHSVISFFEGEDIFVPGKSEMIRNIDKLLKKWDGKKKINQTLQNSGTAFCDSRLCLSLKRIGRCFRQ